MLMDSNFFLLALDFSSFFFFGFLGGDLLPIASTIPVNMLGQWISRVDG